MKCTDCRKMYLSTTTRLERLKKWWLYKFFSEEVIDLSSDKYTQGVSDGYKTGYQAAKESAQAAQDVLKAEISRLQRVYSIDTIIDPNSILSVRNGRLYLGDEQLSDNHQQTLVAEIKALRNFKLWDVMQNTVKSEAIKIGINKATNFEQVLASKMMLHALGVLKYIIDKIEPETLATSSPVDTLDLDSSKFS